jgi:hypothetical protein
MLARTDSEAPRVLAEVHAALRARSDELAVSRAELDSLSGLQSGYCSKLLSPVPIKQVGMESLGPLLTVLGVKLIMVEDLDALRRIGPRLTKRNEQAVRMRARRKRSKRLKFSSEWGKFMAAKRVLSQPKRERTRIARLAAVSRWLRWHDIKEATRAAAKAEAADQAPARGAPSVGSEVGSAGNRGSLLSDAGDP